MSKEKFKGKYRSDTSRLKNWDYTWDAAYFITICTKNREHYFGEIENGKMKLSKIGVLADVFWYEIKNHTKNVELDAFVVMPNHVNGILIINNCLKTNIENNNHCMVVANNCGGVANHCRVVACNDPTMVDGTCTQNPPAINEFMSSISPQSGSVSAIIRSYKSAVTKHTNRLGYDFEWQSRFYDHIIRNDMSYQNIQNYITGNPARWVTDKLFDNNYSANDTKK